MARFIHPQQQQIVSMYAPKNIQFYSDILNKAQSDLERGTAMKAAAIEKLYDIPFSSKEDSDAVVGRAQEILKGTIDADFVSPSKVAQAVMQANAEVMPGVQAAKAKAKAAEMYDKMRMQFGPNFWGGVDPTTQSIVDAKTGKYVDPNQFKASGINAEEVDKAFLASQQQELNYSYDAPTRSDLPGYLKVNKYTGLADQKREELYRPGTASAVAIAKSQLATMPELREVFGSEEAALARLMERNYQTSGNYKQTIDSQYLTDRNYLDAEARARAKDNGTPTVLFKPQDADVEQKDVIDKALNNNLGDKNIKMQSSDIVFDENGKIVQHKYIDRTDASTVKTGQMSDFRPIRVADPKEELRIRDKNIAQNKLITGMRKDLMNQGLSTIKDPTTGKVRARTDKEIYSFYTEAINNSLNVFGKSFQINPGLDIIGSNVFFSPDGKRKDFKNANIELNFNDGKGWQQVDETTLAKEMGYDISKGEQAKSFNSTLKTLSTDSYDFMSGDTKIKSAFTNNDGVEVSMRYNAPPEVRDYKKPVAEMYNAFVRPTNNKKVYLGIDKSVGKPIIITLNSKFASYKGSPVIYPEAVIDLNTPTGKKLQEAYNTGGYEALLAKVQQITDNILVDSGNVYVRKKVNTNDIPE